MPMGPVNAYESNQPSGGMSPGGNRHTQIPGAKLYLDPYKDHQGYGFWTGKFSPKGEKKGYVEDSADMSRLTAFQEKGAPHEVVRYYEGKPDEEEETIKSLTSVEVFELAKAALKAGDLAEYIAFKNELEVRKALAAMGARAPVDTGAGRSAAAGRGNDSMQANRDKRVFNTMHGVDDESTSTEDKDEWSVEKPTPVGAGADSGDSKVSKASAFARQYAQQLQQYGSNLPPPLVLPVQPRSHVAYTRTSKKTGKIAYVKQRGAPKVEEKPKEPRLRAVPDETKEPKWKTLVNNGVVLPPPYKAKGLKVAGQKNPMAEEMFYRLAPHLWPEDASRTPDALFCKNFAEDLQKYAGLKVEPTLNGLRKAGALVVKAWKKESVSKKEASKERAAERRQLTDAERTKLKRKENPHLFAVRDGKAEDLLGFAPTMLVSSVFIGARTHNKWQADERGRFIPAPTYKDIILNGTKFPKDASKYGGTVSDPSVEWVAKVKFADGCGRVEQTTKVLVKGKVADKWEGVQKYTDHYATIQKGIQRDLKSSDALVRERATAMALMDALHIRNGGGEGKGTGACDLTTGDVWLKGNNLLFDFEAKAGERERHQTMGVRKLSDQTVKNLRELGIGDKPSKDKRLLFPHVRPETINGWLKDETGEQKLTAHKVRHHHASLYFAEKWAEVVKKGKPKSKAEARAMLNTATHYAGQKLGHAVKDDPKTGGATARDAYINPRLVQKAMEWMGYDLSTKKEQTQERFKFSKKLQKSLDALPPEGDVYFEGDDRQGALDAFWNLYNYEPSLEKGFPPLILKDMGAMAPKLHDSVPAFHAALKQHAPGSHGHTRILAMHANHAPLHRDLEKYGEAGKKIRVAMNRAANSKANAGLGVGAKVTVKSKTVKLHGLAEKQGKTKKDFDPKKLKQGAKVEMEHTDDEESAEAIAMDHLAEDPRYYTKLKLVEKARGHKGHSQAVASAVHKYGKKMSKAIGTKPSEEREKPVKRAPPNVTAKVGASKNGNKTYDYRSKGKVNPPGEKKSPTETPKPGTNPTGSAGDTATLEVQPERLSKILNVPIEKLQQLAHEKSEEEFVHYFKAKGATFVAKHKVPDAYFSEVYQVLSRDTVKSAKPPCGKCGRTDYVDIRGRLCDRCAFKKGKSLNPKTPKEQLKRRKIDLVKQEGPALVGSFNVNPKKLKKGSEERRFAEAMVVSGVNTLPKLATFLCKGYDLSPSQATSMAKELHTSFKQEGALS